MNLKRSIVIGCALGGVAALVAVAGTSNTRHSDIATPVKTPAIEASGAELAAEIDRLHERLRPAAVPQQPARNLFQFSTARSLPVVASAPAPPAHTEAPAIQPPPAIVLIGIAEDIAADGTPVRTAIISGLGQLFLVKEGDTVTDRYRVAKISAEAVELSQASDGTPLRLVLK